MSVSKQWLANVRQKNKERFGMAGLSGLGSGAGDIVSVLSQRRESVEAAKEKDQEIELERQKLEAAREAGIYVPDMPAVQLPEIKPVPKSVLYVGGAVMVGLFGLIAYSVLKR